MNIYTKSGLMLLFLKSTYVAEDAVSGSDNAVQLNTPSTSTVFPTRPPLTPLNLI